MTVQINASPVIAILGVTTNLLLVYSALFRGTVSIQVALYTTISLTVVSVHSTALCYLLKDNQKRIPIKLPKILDVLKFTIVAFSILLKSSNAPIQQDIHSSCNQVDTENKVVSIISKSDGSKCNLPKLLEEPALLESAKLSASK